MKFLILIILSSLLFQFDVFAVTEEYNKTPRAPQFWDLNEPASTGDNHLSNQKDSNQHNKIPSPHTSSPEESVNNRQIQRIKKQRDIESDDKTSSQHIHKKVRKSESPPSQTNQNPIYQQQQTNRRKSQRLNRSKMNYAPLDSSSSTSTRSKGETSTTKVANPNETNPTGPKSSNIKRLGITTCEIHRPTCDHWFELNRNERRNETKRWKRLHFTSEQRKIESTKRRQKYSNSKIIRERLSKKVKERIARMTEKERKSHLLKKAIVMRRSRKNKKLREQEKMVE